MLEHVSSRLIVSVQVQLFPYPGSENQGLCGFCLSHKE